MATISTLQEIERCEMMADRFEKIRSTVLILQQNPLVIASQMARCAKEKKPLYILEGFNKSDMDALYMLANEFFRDKEYEKASMVFSHLVYYDTLNKGGFLGAGASLQQLQRHEEALKAFTAAVSLDYLDPLPFFYAVDSCIALQNIREAFKNLEQAILRSKGIPSFSAMKEKLTNIATVLKQRKEEELFHVRIQSLEKLIPHQQRKIFTQKKQLKKP